MTNRNIDQIRDLLLGEFMHEFTQRISRVEERLDELEESNSTKIKQLSTHFHKKLEEINNNHQRQYDYLEESIVRGVKEQKSFTTQQAQSLKSELTKEKESLYDALLSLKSRFDKSIVLLQKDYRSKMVSKQSLAGVLFEQSLRLKGDTIEKNLKNQIKKENTDDAR
jgi:exonuclease VII large subunit